MPAYAGKGQPPVALGWFGGGQGWWGDSPRYAGHETSAIRKEDPIGYMTGPLRPADCQPVGRTIAIVIPRDIAEGDQKH
jgi:hypothetical protein